MSFFASGSVDTNNINRSKLPEGTYLVKLTDFADFYGATNGDRTQLNFEVVEGCVPAGTKGSHVVMHAADAQWKKDKARGEIAAMLGAFLGFSRDASGIKVSQKVFDDNTRIVQQSNGKTVSVTRGADDLPILGKTAVLVVAPYFDKKTGVRKVNPKTRQPSVTYEVLPMSCGLKPTMDLTASGEFPVDAPEDDAPPADKTADALALAHEAGWKPNPNAPGFFYKKGEPKQLKEAALLAMFGG